MRSRTPILLLVGSMVASGCAFAERVSVNLAGDAPVVGDSEFGEEEGTISGDGRFVAFVSASAELVPDDTNGVADVFVRDLADGVTERVSVAAGGTELSGSSSDPSLSADGRVVVFHYDGIDIDGAPGLFVHDLAVGLIERVDRRHDGSAPATPAEPSASVSGDGRYVVFASVDDLLLPPGPLAEPTDTNGVVDVFRRDLTTGVVERLSVGPGGTEADGASSRPSIDFAGQHVAFESAASNLIVGDTNTCSAGSPSCPDVFLWEPSGVTRVSEGASEGDDASRSPMVSADGSTVVFKTAATNLVAGLTAPTASGAVVVADLAGGSLETVGPVPDAPTVEGPAAPSVSGDGRFVAFESATSLTPGVPDHPELLYVFDRTAERPILVSSDESQAQGPGSYGRPRLSADGRYVAMVVDCCVGPSTVELRSVIVPEITDITPATIPTGSATEITVTGAGFLAASVLAVAGTDLTVGPLVIDSDSQLRATVTPTPGAQPGPRTVWVTSNGTGPGIVAGSAAQCLGCLIVEDRRPNVVVVLLDDARPDEMALVADMVPGGGFAWIRDNGVVFDQLFMANNLCCPARVTLMTGQTSFNHGKRDNLSWLDLQENLALWLQGERYCTAFAGKWLNLTAAHREVRPAGFTFWEPLLEHIDDEYGYTIQDNAGTVLSPGVFQTDHLADRSLAHLQDCLDSGRPAFVNFWPFPPHFGADPAPEYAATTVPYIPNANPAFGELDLLDKPTWLQTGAPANDPNLWFAAYTVTQRRVRSLLSVDDGVRQLIDELSTRGELDDTIIMLLGDNGSLLGEHRILDRKHLAYEAAQPTIWIAGPGYDPGTTSAAFIGNIDLAPTIAAVAGATPGLVVDGVPIPDVMGSPDQGLDRFFPVDVAASNAVVPHPSASGVRTSRYKYIEYDDPGPISIELYDLDLDPFELVNVADDPAYSAVQAAMQSLMASSLECAGAACRESVDPLLQSDP